MEVPRHWRLKKQRYQLMGEICPHCDGKHFPPRQVCPDCGGEIDKATIIASQALFEMGTRKVEPIPVATD